AEDRIRDRNVTGVQTCDLPIYIQRQERNRLKNASYTAMKRKEIKKKKVNRSGKSYSIYFNKLSNVKISRKMILNKVSNISKRRRLNKEKGPIPLITSWSLFCPSNT